MTYKNRYYLVIDQKRFHQLKNEFINSRPNSSKFLQVNENDRFYDHSSIALSEILETARDTMEHNLDQPPVIVLIEKPDNLIFNENEDDNHFTLKLKANDVQDDQHLQLTPAIKVLNYATHLSYFSFTESFIKQYPSSYKELIKDKDPEKLGDFDPNKIANLFQDYADKSGFIGIFWGHWRHHGDAAKNIAKELNKKSNAGTGTIKKILADAYLYETLINKNPVVPDGSFQRRLDYSILQLSDGLYTSMGEFLEANPRIVKEFKIFNNLITNEIFSDTDSDISDSENESETRSDSDDTYSSDDSSNSSDDSSNNTYRH